MLPDKLPLKTLRLHPQMPQFFLVTGFALVILVGTLLLLLPWSQRQGNVGWVDALFTATSAVCVTGLIVVDTATAYTRFGQIVILVLIQIGGLGIMTFAALAFLIMGRRLSLASQAALHDSFFQRDLGLEFKKKFLQIILMTATLETMGGLLLFLTLWKRQHPVPEALFSGVFHAISAFCNAGFSLYTDNLMGLRDSPMIMTVIMLLIVLGGLGHMVVQEIWLWLKARGQPIPGATNPVWPLSVHSRVVLRVTAVLLVGGWLGLLMFGMTKGEETWGLKITTALFQSVTARTAGFNTVDIGLLPLSSLLLLLLLMFIGGSPGSCAGGVKTTAVAISLAEVRAYLKGEDQVRLLFRRVPPDTVRRTTILIRLAVVWNIIGVLLLLATEAGKAGIGLHDVIFEQISAFGTVGLSTGLTFKLSDPGKIWLTATMFLGRLGPITLALWVLPAKHIHVGYPETRIMIG